MAGRLTLWRLIPAAAPEDPHWQGRRAWREVIVRAESAAQARLIAAGLERQPGRPPVGNESLDERSGFLDEKLYWAVPLEADEAAAEGADGGVPAILRAVPL